MPLTNLMNEPLYTNVRQGQKPSDPHSLVYELLGELSCVVEGSFFINVKCCKVDFIQGWIVTVGLGDLHCNDLLKHKRNIELSFKDFVGKYKSVDKVES